MNTNNGWKVVPERATKAMQDAWDTAPFSDDTDAEFQGAYAAMIAAAPASAQPERDWELTCADCDGDGFVYVERRIGMCATDVQTFKEDCECCEGRDFTIAFQDIPGIAEYVKSCRPASTVADEGAKEYGSPARILRQFLTADGFIAACDIPEICARLRPAAPAAGDAQEAVDEAFRILRAARGSIRAHQLAGSTMLSTDSRALTNADDDILRAMKVLKASKQGGGSE